MTSCRRWTGETSTIPILFVLVGDPVASGFVASLARPGGNITGFAIFEAEIGGKWLEVLKEIALHVNRTGFILHLETAAHVRFFEAAKAVAPSLGVEVIALGVHTNLEIERAIAEFAERDNGGLIIGPHAITLNNRELIIRLASRYRLPAVFGLRYDTRSGGLVAYGPNPISPLSFSARVPLAELALKHRLPGMFGARRTWRLAVS